MPTYHALGNHTEALQVDFDPSQISFKDIVNTFWRSHNPIGPARSSQYKSAIWYANQSQLDVIQSTVQPLIAKYERELTTEVQPLGIFYNAEDYHQKYSLQRFANLMQTFNAMYPKFQDFIDSTAAARLNGFAAGHGDKALFEEEKQSYGHELSELAAIVSATT